MLETNTKLRAKQDIPHGFFCINPECEMDATEIVAGETGKIVDVYDLGFEVELDENENRWWFYWGQLDMWEVVQ
jgi:hypothetical protein